MLKSLVGSASERILQDARPDHTLDRSEELIRHNRSTAKGRGRQRRRVFARVAEALRAGGPKSTPTTKGSSASSAVLEQIDMFQRFEHVQGTGGFPPKPAPDVIYPALVALGAQPEKLSLRAGLPADIEAGGRARVEVYAARHGCATLLERVRFGPDYRVNDLPKLATVAANAS